MNKNACNGTLRLSKSAFLSFLGSKKYTRTPGNPADSLDEMEKIKIQDELALNNGNLKLTAAKLRMSLSTLRRKLERWANQVNTAASDELQSPSPSRRYFENLKSPWEIVSFNPSTREVCINIRSRSGDRTLSVIIPNYKFDN